MMIDTLSVSEATFALRSALGPMRSWNDFLTDCSRKDTIHYLGLRLLPVVRIQLPGDHSARPRYATSEVRTFILSALCLASRPADTKALRKVKLKIDPVMLSLPLGMRHAEPA